MIITVIYMSSKKNDKSLPTHTLHYSDFSLTYKTLIYQVTGNGILILIKHTALITTLNVELINCVIVKWLNT